MVDCLFAYGTLLAPELLHSVVGRTIEGRPAVLAGYVCRRVRRAAYPAIAQQSGDSTHGRVFCGIDDRGWLRLDEFESDLYERRLVEVTHQDDTRTVAYTYVIGDEHKSYLTEEAWELERFRRLHLKRYLTQLSN